MSCARSAISGTRPRRSSGSSKRSATQQVAYLWGVSTGPTAARPWFLDRAGGGGNLLERGSHQLDLQRAVAGQVASVQVAASAVHLAQSEVDEPGDIEDAATMTLRFESGAVGTVLLAWTAQGQPGAYSLDVLAPAATLRIKLDPAFTLSGQVGDEQVKRTMTVHPFERSVARFVEAVRAGDPGARLLCAARCAGDARDSARVRALTARRGPLRRAHGGGRVTMAGTPGLDPFFVPAAHTLPSNAAYLAHLAAAADDPSLIRLASNENTEPPSPRVRAALEDAFLDANLSPPPMPPLQLALAARHGVEPSQVLVTAGSTEVIDALFRTFLRAGSEAVIPSPSWPVYRRRLEALEARIVEIPLERTPAGYRYDVDALLGALSAATRIIVVCSPNNPTGNVMETADLHRLAGTGIPLLVDAAYADFDPDRDPMPLVHAYDNVIVTRTFSKAYCLAGVRVGYAVGAADVLDHVDRFLVPGSSVSSPALHAGLAALEDEEYHDRQIARIGAERERLLPRLRELGLQPYPSAGNFVAVDCADRPGGAAALAAAVLRRGVLVRPLGTLVRISIGRADENDALVDALTRALGSEDGS